MICPRCGHEQAEGIAECTACGIIFAKLHAQRTGPTRPIPAEEQSEDLPPGDLIRALLFAVNRDSNPFTLACKALLLVILILWGFKFFFAPIAANAVGSSFLHLVNLPFHEAGHIIFGFFGAFPGVLGGSLLQVLMPLICLGTFLFKMHDPFAAAVTPWWAGESCMDLAPYINDARALELVLIGGITGRDNPDMHDWANILERLGLLEYDHLLAVMANGLGMILMLTAGVWGGYLLWKEWLALPSHKSL